MAKLLLSILKQYKLHLMLYNMVGISPYHMKPTAWPLIRQLLLLNETAHQFLPL